jgi:hypothetical protein
MIDVNRRSVVKLLGLAPLAATPMIGLPLPAAAQQDLVVLRKYEIFKRGTIHSLDPSTRGLTVVWEDLGRIKMKAADLVTNYAQLKPGQICDIHWYSYVDFLVAKTTPQVSAQAKAMVARGARAEGFPGSEQQIRLFEMSGLVIRLDQTAYTIEMVNPNSGEVVRAPQIITENGLAALRTLKPGDLVTTVFSVETALKVTIIR